MRLICRLPCVMPPERAMGNFDLVLVNAIKLFAKAEGPGRLGMPSQTGDLCSDEDKPTDGDIQSDAVWEVYIHRRPRREPAIEES